MDDGGLIWIVCLVLFVVAASQASREPDYSGQTAWDPEVGAIVKTVGESARR